LNVACFLLCFSVLTSARTGLIFTGIQADPTWPNRAGYSIPCAVMLGSGWGELGVRNSLAAQERAAAAVGESGSLGSTVLCCVFSLSVSLLLLFPLFAVLLNCPYPNPPVSASFFPFSSAPRRGEGRPCGAFVASRSQTITQRDSASPRIGGAKSLFAPLSGMALLW